MSRDDGVDGPERIVRCEAAEVDLRHRRDRARFENPAAMGEVRLQERGAAELEDFAECPLREQALARQLEWTLPARLAPALSRSPVAPAPRGTRRRRAREPGRA